MDSATQVQILDSAIYISHDANILEKRINPTILPPAMDKTVGQIELFSLGMATSLGGKTKFKLVIDLEKDGLRQAVLAQGTLHK